MGEIRRNPITGDPVILSTTRADRPGAWSEDAPRDGRSDCPFCPGNEAETPPEIERTGATAWQARAVPNKYPAIFEPENPPHEVIIDSPDHDLPFERLGIERLTAAIDFWKKRANAQSESPRRRYVSLFRNEGRGSGQSIPHPHSQILALDFVPPRIAREFQGFRNQPCPLCRLVEEETRSGEVLIDETPSLVLFAPRAAKAPFEMWVAPRNHAPTWTECLSADLARLLLSAVGRLRAIHPDAPFNLGLLTAPLNTDEADRFHWYAELTPRLTSLAGFEYSTGAWINIESPERAAARLRQTVPVRTD
jgi:UDPglucose--hexose-1-phosphate uridylyltransferase